MRHPLGQKDARIPATSFHCCAERNGTYWKIPPATGRPQLGVNRTRTNWHLSDRKSLIFQNAKLPPFPGHMTRIERTLVQTSEYCIYGLLFIQPITGLSATITRGRSFVLFWWHIPPLMPHYPTLRAALLLVHRIGAGTLGVLITAHAVTALIH